MVSCFSDGKVVDIGKGDGGGGGGGGGGFGEERKREESGRTASCMRICKRVGSWLFRIHAPLHTVAYFQVVDQTIREEGHDSELSEVL